MATAALARRSNGQFTRSVSRGARRVGSAVARYAPRALAHGRKGLAIAKARKLELTSIATGAVLGYGSRPGGFLTSLPSIASIGAEGTIALAAGIAAEYTSGSAAEILRGVCAGAGAVAARDWMARPSSGGGVAGDRHDEELIRF